MCVIVRRTETATPLWNRDDVAIDVPRHLTTGEAMLMARQLLTEMGVPQSTMGITEAVCFCGDPVRAVGLTPFPRRHAVVIQIPRQRIDIMEVARGA